MLQFTKKDRVFLKIVLKNTLTDLKDQALQSENKDRAKLAQTRIKKAEAAASKFKSCNSVKQRPGSACITNKTSKIDDLRCGAKSINHFGVNQNTSCMFHFQVVEKVQNSQQKEEVKIVQKKCKCNCGYMKANLDQRNPYITLQCEKPLCNLSPYLKASRNISDTEEEKILEMIDFLKSKAKNWDNEEDEKLRRYSELQDSSFRTKLLACMKEHIQEFNLLKSFFLRFKYTHVPQRPKSQIKQEIKSTHNAKVKKNNMNLINDNVKINTIENTQPICQTKDFEKQENKNESKTKLAKTEKNHREVKLNDEVTIITNQK